MPRRMVGMPLPVHAFSKLCNFSDALQSNAQNDKTVAHCDDKGFELRHHALEKYFTFAADYNREVAIIAAN
jgi:hypothetical protein